ncbi:nicotinate-nucleotide adenylyltransferase [Pantoea sp. Mhis]|uniref:nicotinate-nucleotide adenylyltransferase n=1 Tax=Pantoea sp. Mhis TaxID=2576759 RepID=UPI00135C4635|nr:nicotinate-nucleotide adenylyltransferase [Pantoea sp. Mhis]MXP56269.1 nicotinate-nucleotide adenylyltransferase [Pantoea sp. Mhis]
MNKLYVIFGGTFDPIHYGHLYSAMLLARQLKINQITLLPNNIPPHRSQPIANAQQRIKMLQIAITKNQLFRIDKREFEYPNLSWTIKVLKTLRTERGTKQPIAFIIGQDSLLTIQTWHHWDDILSFCHLLVCPRPNYSLQMNTSKMQGWLDNHCTSNINQLYHKPNGFIWLCNIPPLFNISSMQIRQRYNLGLPCRGLLPDKVINYIEQVGLYSD